MDREQGIKLMQDLLRRVVDKKASDLFITAGFPPAIKIDGEVRPQSERALTNEQSAVLVRSIMNDRQTKEFDATKECNFAIAPPGIGRFRVNTFVQQGNTGCVIRLINSKIPTLEELELPPDPQGSRAVEARPLHPGGRHGLGQVDLTRRDGGLSQRKDPRPYRHHRRSGRIRAPAQGLRDHASRSGRRHGELAHRAQEHAAPGARRHPDRRNPRSRDHGVRHSVRRNRPPGAGDAARQQLQPGARPHHQLLPRRAARTAAHGSVAEHPRAGVAAARAPRGRRAAESRPWKSC